METEGKESPTPFGDWAGTLGDEREMERKWFGGQGEEIPRGPDQDSWGWA